MICCACWMEAKWMLRRNFTVDGDRIEENHLYLSSKFLEGKTKWEKTEKEGDFEVGIKDFMWSSPNLRQNSCSASVDCQFCSEGVVIVIWVACWPPTRNPFNPYGMDTDVVKTRISIKSVPFFPIWGFGGDFSHESGAMVASRQVSKQVEMVKQDLKAWPRQWDAWKRKSLLILYQTVYGTTSSMK